MSKSRWSQLDRRVIQCNRCKRLRRHCEKVAVEKRKAYLDDDYWGRPVPNFGSPKADLLIVGLAPAAHGANRTGRMFTGDRSGEWLYRALHNAGFATQPESTDVNDGLELINCTITSICRCAPPANKPLTEELDNCQPFLAETFELCQPQVIVTLGGLAWRSTIIQLVESEWMRVVRPRPKFSHGALVEIKNGRWLLGSYHPSQQNTFTGRLTRKMLDDIFIRANRLIDS